MTGRLFQTAKAKLENIIRNDRMTKLAGVSPTTVSRVINNYGYLSQKQLIKFIKRWKN